jgi:adenosylhomocysteine nucleosidase
MTFPTRHSCVIFALRREARPFLQFCRPRQRLHAAPCWASWCGSVDSPVLVLQTGIGQRCTQTALEWLSRNGARFDSPERVISAGFAGALDHSLHAREVVAAGEVVDDQGRCWTTQRPKLLSVLDIGRGRLLTWPRLVGDPAEKRRLAQTFGACTVDMESAVVAAFCAEQGIPFLSLRAVSDDAQTALSPQLLGLLARERVSGWRLGLAALSSPRLLGECWRLARTTRRAAERLARALNAVLTDSRRSYVPSEGCLGDVCRA